MIQKIVAIHQPNYLPWAGYFLKMAACDVFVFHDNVQITKSGPTRRVKIASRNAIDKTQWLTVPLKKHSDFALIKDLEISWDTDWANKHLNHMKDAYSDCPYFDEYFPKIIVWYQEAKQFNLLSEMNIYFIKKIMNELGLCKEVLCSSALPVSGKASSYNLAITNHLCGTQYLSGAGADKYQEEIEFSEQGIQLMKLGSVEVMNLLLLKRGMENINYKHSILELIFKIDKNNLEEIFSLSNFDIH